MADDIYYPHCTTCGRVFDTARESDRCDHRGNQPLIRDVLRKRLAQEEGEHDEYLKRNPPGGKKSWFTWGF